MLNRSFLIGTLLAIASAAQAGPIFSDNFDTDVTAFNQTTFLSGWTVTGGGTVDLIGAVGFFDLLQGNGRYVDLDGSTGKAGLFSNSWMLSAGVTYRADFDLAGNQRAAGDDLVDVQFGTQSAHFVLGEADNFGHMSISYTPTASGLYSLSFQNNGNDNMGALLDNVSINIVPQRVTVFADAEVQDVPEPAMGALFVAGMLGLGLAKRYRRV